MTGPKIYNEVTIAFDEIPDPGEMMKIADGVYWIRMPMPFVLDHINIVAIEDGDGWAILDTGLEQPETVKLWRALMAGPLMGRPITKVIITHMHPDHIGMAGWLTRRFDCRLWISRLEYLTCRTLLADTMRQAPQAGISFYTEAGWDKDQIEDYQTKFGNFGKFIHPMPDSFRRISEGDKITIGGREWQVLVGAGHSPEHACLYCPELKIFLSGDQVIPRISSNISVFPTEPDANPMLDWLKSLHHIRDSIPDDVLVVPSHKTCFYGLHHRVEELLAEHHGDFAKLKAALDKPKRAVDVFEYLFSREIGMDLLNMATGEAIADLNYLIAQGEVTRTVDDNGVAWYSQT